MSEPPGSTEYTVIPVGSGIKALQCFPHPSPSHGLLSGATTSVREERALKGIGFPTCDFLAFPAEQGGPGFRADISEGWFEYRPGERALGASHSIRAESWHIGRVQLFDFSWYEKGLRMRMIDADRLSNQ